MPGERWTAALALMPEDDGPEAVPPPDRPPARVIDLPEVLALRALLMDRKVPFDTVERWIRALTLTTRLLEYERPLGWTAEQVAARLAAIANGGEGSAWSTLEVVRELWLWHPDRPFIDVQTERLLVWLEHILSERDGA